MAKRAPAPVVGQPKIRKPRQPKDPGVPKARIEEEEDDKKRRTPKIVLQLYKDISDAAKDEMKDVEATFDALSELVVTKLRKDGRFTIPKIVLFRLKDTKARPATTKKLFDKEVPIAARPAGKRVHPLVLKPLKVAVSAAAP